MYITRTQDRLLVGLSPTSEILNMFTAQPHQDLVNERWSVILFLTIYCTFSVCFRPEILVFSYKIIRTCTFYALYAIAEAERSGGYR